MNDVKGLLRPCLVLLALFSALTGLVYPAVVTAAARLVFPAQAAGSLLASGGSTLIGQPFDQPRYFWGRPSATTPYPDDAAASTGSNLAPSSPALFDAVKARGARLRAADPGNSGPIPIDLVTASASGLDPHISPAAALYQAERVARARQLPPARVRALIGGRIEPRTFGILGERRVNVLLLNRDLDALAPHP
jgi:K+-transporting ATPase ATPase C chain